MTRSDPQVQPRLWFLWFLVLPCLVYVTVLGLVATLMGFVGEQPAA